MTERNLTPKAWAELSNRMPEGRERRYVANVEPILTEMRDGRKLAVRILGPAYGIPIVRFHGNPGSSIAPLPPEEELEAIGIRLLSFDRAGYGLSDRHEGLRIGDTALDVADMLGAIKVTGKFGLIASSGGVSHALGTASSPELKDRISGLVVMAGKAPWEAGNSADSTTDDNLALYQAARENIALLRRTVTQRAKRVQTDKFGLMELLLPELKYPDQLYFLAEGLARAIAIGHSDGFRQNGDGWFDDILALQKPSGFSVTDIQAPTLIWQGSNNDPFTDVEDSHWINGQIPNSQLITDPDAGHFGSIEVTPPALLWLRNQHIGSERAGQIRDGQVEWLNKWTKHFNETWATVPFARGDYAVDNYSARDTIRNGIIETADLERYAARIAVEHVLVELKA